MLCCNPNNTATTAIGSGYTCGRPTGGSSHGPTISRTRSTRSASCPRLSPVIRSHGGGWPSINFHTKMIYRIPAAVPNQDTLRPAAATHRSYSPLHLWMSTYL